MSDEPLLQAAGGLALRRDGVGRLRLAFRGASDWLGAISAGLAAADGTRREPALLGAEPHEGTDDLGAFDALRLRFDLADLPLHTSLRAYRERPLLVFRCEAAQDLAKLGSGRLDAPRLAWPWLRPTLREPGGAPAGARSYGHQLSEFGFPTHGDADFAGFVFVPHRPRVLLPLLLAAPAGALLLAPLSGFHELVGAVPAGEDGREAGVAIGWHGDLDEVPRGFATELALLAGEAPRALLEEWGALLQRRAGTRRRGRYDDALVGGLSYWTDNGSVYYYRTAPGSDYTETLGRKLDELAGEGIPARSLQLDSWFYPHEQLRPVSSEGAPVVPPTGMLRWEPREDLFPEGFAPLRERIGGLPLTFHSRHFSARSPYFERHAAWVDGGQAQPQGPELFEALIEQASAWGAVTYEQDWLVESFLGVRGLREAPGRAAAWQRALDAAAARRGLSLQWCMATPADFMESVHLGQLASIRTSGDYRYLYDNALNWVWFLHGNALARALGLWPYKDVFLSHPPTPEGFGDVLGEAESLLAALSAGPVGIGDQLGHTRRELVLRTCRADGVLVKPDLPVAALDRCFRGHGYFGERAPRRRDLERPPRRPLRLPPQHEREPRLEEERRAAHLPRRLRRARRGAADRPRGALRLAQPPLRAPARGRGLRREPRLPGVRLPRALPAAPGRRGALRRRDEVGDARRPPRLAPRGRRRRAALRRARRAGRGGGPRGLRARGAAPRAPLDARRERAPPRVPRARDGPLPPAPCRWESTASPG